MMKCSNSVGSSQGVTTTLSQERELAIHHWLESEGYFMYWWYLAIQVPLVPVPLASCLGSLSSKGGEGAIAAYSVKNLPSTDLHHLSFAHCEFYPTFFTRAGSHVTWRLSNASYRFNGQWHIGSANGLPVEQISYFIDSLTRENSSLFSVCFANGGNANANEKGIFTLALYWLSFKNLEL